MKKFMFFTAIMLMITCQNTEAQTDGVDYSFKGISQTLNKFQVVSLNSFQNGLAIIEVKQGDKRCYGIINKFGKLIIPCGDTSYMKIKINEGLIPLYNQRIMKYGYVDSNGETIIDFQYSRVNPFSEGLAAVQTKEDERIGSWSFIDRKGNVVIPTIKMAPQVGEFHDGVAAIGCIIMTDNDIKNAIKGTYLIDKNGNVVSDKKPYECDGYSEGLYIVCNNERGLNYGMYGLMDKRGKMVVPTEYKYIKSFTEGLAACKNKNGYVGYIDTEGKVKISFQFDKAGQFENGIAVVKKNGKYGFINIKGEIIIPCQFESADIFCEGLASVKQNGKWGFVNEKGDIVIPCQYDNCDNFSEGFVVVWKNQQCALIDKKGETIVDFGKAEIIENFSEGLAVIKMNGKYGYMNKQLEAIFR